MDGSRSFDIDGDSFNLTWFVQDRFSLLTTQAVARVVLPVGTTVIGLLADDGALVDLRSWKLIRSVTFNGEGSAFVERLESSVATRSIFYRLSSE